MNYLQLCNNVLQELGEVTITTVASQVGFQGFITDVVNKSIRDITKAELQWPWNYTAGSDSTVAGVAEYTLTSSTVRHFDPGSFMLEPTDLVTNGSFASTITNWTDNSTGTGSSSHTTDGDGRLRLAGGASGIGSVYQSISTVANTVYRLYVRTFTGDITLNVGTSIGGTEILTQTLSVANVGDGNYNSILFTPTSSTTYINFQNSANANHDVDAVVAIENFDPVPLTSTSLAEWRNTYSATEKLSDPTTYTTPSRVVFTKNRKYKLSPVPDKSTYTVTYDTWGDETELSADTDTPAIDTKYHDVITARARYYAYLYRSDSTAAGLAKAEYDAGLLLMRTESINNDLYVVAV